MEIRKIRSNERIEFHKLCQYAFSDWEVKDIKEEDLLFYDINDIIGGFENNKLISGLINHKFKQYIRGTKKNMGGIGAVSTYPEYRNKGFVRDLMLKAFEEMKTNNISVSMLAPFKESFYRNLGYIAANSNQIIEFSTSSLKHYLKKNTKEHYVIERFSSLEVKDEYVDYIKKTAPKQYHGIVVLDEISKKWEKRYKDTLTVFIKTGDKIHATARYYKKGFYENGIIKVVEMYWSNLEGRNKLFSFFANHRDQIRKISFIIPFGVNFYKWFEDVMETVKVKIDLLDWMVRIIDIEEALKGISIDIKGEIFIKVIDKYCSWNNGNYKMFYNNGILDICRTEKVASVQIDIKAISALLFGVLQVEELEVRGLIKINNIKEKKLLDMWFTQRYLFNPIYF